MESMDEETGPDHHQASMRKGDCDEHCGRRGHRKVTLLQTLVLLSLALLRPRLVAQASAMERANDDDDLAIVEDEVDESTVLESYLDVQKRLRNEEAVKTDQVELQVSDNDVIVVATVDGMLAGLSKKSGRILWKRSAPANTSSNSHLESEWPPGSHRLSEAPLLHPLVATTTTVKTSNSDWRTAAVPSIDGTVYLTAPGRRDAGDAEDVTVTTTIHDLVERSPFVDARGRIYTGTRHATAFAIDGDTGDILAVSAADGQSPQRQAIDGNVIWLGRVDYQVSVQESRSGDLDVRFASSRIMSVNDMLLGSDAHQPWQADRRRSHGLMPKKNNNNPFQEQSSFLLSSKPPPALVATPNGNVAYRNPQSGTIQWVADECFHAPVAFAVDSATGSSLGIDIVPDAVMPHGSPDYVTREMERQMELAMMAGDDWTADQGDDDDQTLVGSLPSGELFAMPLVKRQKVSSIGQKHSTSAAASSANPNGRSFHVSRVSQLSGRQHSHFNHEQKHGAIKKGCHPGSPYFPGCLVSTSDGGFGRDSDGSYLSEAAPNMDGGAIVPFYHPDFGYVPPKHHFTLKNGESESRRRYRKSMKVFGHWLPAAIAFLFVVSFEIGRRKRQKDAQKVELESTQLTVIDGKTSQTTNVGVIQVFDDVILGYGGHGTVVFKGMLEGRQVAVKRMLRAYHASADREISLLIESDGHPNVVRYFLKEVRGDFVYLALELCDLSLHDLIVTLRSRSDHASSQVVSSVSPATKTILLQIASGVRHLHHLRIVHRDLKPMNILLADKRKKSLRSENEPVHEIFERGGYIAKISDMGLGKQLVGQSSYGASLIGESSLGPHSNGAQSSAAGAVPGSVGWQAPEVMAMRLQSDCSVRSDGSGNLVRSDGSISAVEPSADVSSSPIDLVANSRTSRSTDIFSLGCIFFSTLVPGSHPFGEWYEREANIVHNRPNLDALEALSLDAYDLVSSMIQRNQNVRPTAKQICDHPFFWPADRRLAFLCDFSDRLETGAGANANGESNTAFASRALAVERNAAKVVGLAWDSVLDDDLISNVQRFRTYDPSSVRDLLRLIRNKHHHFDELPDHVKTQMGCNSEGLMNYFDAKFPRLLIHCVTICREILPLDDPLCIKYAISPIGRPSTRRLEIQVSTISELSASVETESVGLRSDASPMQDDEDKATGSRTSTPTPAAETEDEPDLETIPETNELVHAERVGSLGNGEEESKLNEIAPDAAPEPGERSSRTEQVESGATPAEVGAGLVTNVTEASVPIPHQPALPEIADVSDLVIWECSTAAKTFNSRGWSRSDEEWERRVDANLRKRDSALVRCAEDPRFRTRLCNHWDESMGTFCPMLKKKKCIFAHGPVELRVKEAKRHRWGKLVDRNGDNNNPNHSGGEDTYGAARSIESERKQEGKWSTDKKTKNKKPTATKKTLKPNN